MDFLKELLGNAQDLSSLLPDLNQVLTDLIPVIRFTVLLGPAVLLIMGLVYLFLAPKEANHTLGFRCWWGMSSMEVWQFTQKLAGIVWGGLGIILAIVAIIGCVIMVGQELSKATSTALTILIIEAVAALLAFLTVEITVILRYDMNGSARKKKK